MLNTDVLHCFKAKQQREKKTISALNSLAQYLKSNNCDRYRNNRERERERESTIVNLSDVNVMLKQKKKVVSFWKKKHKTAHIH